MRNYGEVGRDVDVGDPRDHVNVVAVDEPLQGGGDLHPRESMPPVVDEADGPALLQREPALGDGHEGVGEDGPTGGSLVRVVLHGQEVRSRAVRAEE